MKLTIFFFVAILCSVALGVLCVLPETKVYTLAKGADPVAFAQRHHLVFLRNVGKLKNVYEFQVLCQTNERRGGEEDTGDVMKRDSDVVKDFGVQRKRLLHPRTQWHLHDEGNGAYTHLDHPWASGKNGLGSVVSIVDDGLAWQNDDLRPRFSLELSANYNSGTITHDPSPNSIYSSHGTGCAGVAAASGKYGPPPQNAPGCAFGVAPMATLAGVRLISEPVSDATEATALMYGHENVTVYSCSWGPQDDGTVLEGPGELTCMAIEEGSRMGRHGKGCVYVWAAGNGGERGDSCAYDGYASNVHVISVGAVAKNGMLASYSEQCAGLFVTAPSSGYGWGITTTSLPTSWATTKCREDFGGTSAAAPYVAGAIAIMAQVNPNLTATDLMRVLALSARVINPTDASWITNAARIRRSHKYGFGVVDIEAATSLASTMKNKNDVIVAPLSPFLCGEMDCLNLPLRNNHFVRESPQLTFKFNVTDDLITEHVVVSLSVSHSYRGRLVVTITSPANTQSTFSSRLNDHGRDYDAWPFHSLDLWGERALGIWRVSITDTDASHASGTVQEIRFSVMGCEQT